MATLAEIMALKEQSNPYRGLAELGNTVADIMRSRKEKQASETATENQAQAASLLAQASENPEQGQQLFAQAYNLAPKFVSGFVKAQKEKSDLDSKGGTRYQAVPFETGFRVFDRKTGEFSGDLIEDEAAAAKAAAELDKAGKVSIASANEGQKKAATFARRMFDSADQMELLEDKIDPTNRIISFISGGSGVTSELANRVASPDEQQYATAASDFVTAQLRKESGAAIGPDEFDRKYREFFPVVGDKEEQIKAKRERRRKAAQDMALESGGLYEEVFNKPDEQSSTGSVIVIENHPIYGDITEEDIQATMKGQGLTRKQVLERLNNG